MRRPTRSALALAIVGTMATVAAARDDVPTAPVERDLRPLPFVSDDYARALGEARARALPLFIEAWAPW